MIPSRVGPIEDRVRRITEILDKNIMFEDNINSVFVDVADTGTADVEFTVRHALGRIPLFYFYNIDQEGVVYDSNRATWNEVNLTLKCSVSNAVLKLLVI